MNLTGPTSHRLISQRLKLHYVDWGNKDAPPLVLLHGGRDHCRSWDWTAEVLRKNWHVIALDLRGHGDSDWSPDGDYSMAAYLYDMAQLIHQLALAPVTIVAHSLGGNLALRYAGLYPANVRRIAAIEGLGPSPAMLAERLQTPMAEHIRKWIDEKRSLSARAPKRYQNLDDAFARMKSENKFLSEEQARHLTLHGATQNEDGTWSWKFDNYIRMWPPFDITHEDLQALWRAIDCPTLLVYGNDSWASNPQKDGRAKSFRHARVISFANAGHWVHHDQFDAFMQELKAFL
jgi:pimeloyl-ACP methyl ester carboxylesterase